MSDPQPFPVWLDGRLHAPGGAAVPAEDSGFLLGLSVFDTLLWERGWLYFRGEHLARLRSGALALRIAWPPPWDVSGALDEFCRSLGGRDAAVRITLTRGVPGGRPSLAVTGRELARPADPGVAVVISAHTKHSGEPVEVIKSTNRARNILAREEAFEQGAWEALLPTEEGDLSEGTFSNLFAFTGGRLVTPDVRRGALAGIVREKLLEDLLAEPPAHPVETGRLEQEDLRRASEVLLTNTTGGVVPVVSVLGLVEGLPGSEGPVAADLRRRLRRLEERDRP